MYHITSFPEVIKSQYQVSKKYSDLKISNKRNLKNSYLKFLEKIQKDCKPNFESHKITYSLEAVEKAKKAFGFSKLNDLGQENSIGETLDIIKANKLKDKINRAIYKLKNIDVNLYHVFDIVVNEIVLSRCGSFNSNIKAFGGTSQKGLGLIWISDYGSLSQIDLIELIIHETTHNLVFIDELVHSHFDYNYINDKDTWCISAILDSHRPIDKVYHSIIVASEILLFRHCNNAMNTGYSLHPNTKDLLKTTRKSIASFMSNKNVARTAKPRTYNIVDLIDNKLIDIFGKIV